MHKQLATQQKSIDKNKDVVQKCKNVTKTLLIEKVSTSENTICADTEIPRPQGHFQSIRAVSCFAKLPFYNVDLFCIIFLVWNSFISEILAFMKYLMFFSRICLLHSCEISNISRRNAFSKVVSQDFGFRVFCVCQGGKRVNEIGVLFCLDRVTWKRRRRGRSAWKIACGWVSSSLNGRARPLSRTGSTALHSMISLS